MKKFEKPALLDKVIRLRISEDDHVELSHRAGVAGLTVSEYLRRAALSRPIAAKTDDAMIRELRRVAGLMKHVWSQGDGLYSEETAEAIRAVTACIERVARGKQ